MNAIENITRYNLGLGWFGPLEQCKDGKIMLAEDVIKAVNEECEAFEYVIGNLNDDVALLQKENFERCFELGELKVDLLIERIVYITILIFSIGLNILFLR